MPNRSDNFDSARVQVVRGRAQIVERAAALERLALRCDQAGSMHWLAHFFAVPTFRGKTPYLVLGVGAGEALRWAVLVYEFTPLGMATGVYSTDDISGFRSVVGRAEERGAAASAATAALLERGAQLVMISWLKAGHAAVSVHWKMAARWAARERTVANTLPLEDSYEATLMSLGKATRFNMRYYRRRLLRTTQCEYVEDLRGTFTEREFDELNEASLNQVGTAVNRLQYASACTLEGGFLVGLRAEDGRWLGVVGGWRQADTAVLLWQMNRAGLERNSIGTVVRGYFLEHEVARGARRVMFYGGSPNSIQNSFVPDVVVDVMAVRRTVMAWWLMKLAAVLAWPRWPKRGPNFLAAAFCDEALEWRATSEASRTAKMTEA